MNNIITSINTSVPIKGTGKTLGMTDGTNNASITVYSGVAYLAFYASLYNKNVGTAESGSSTNTRVGWGVTTDTSKSGIVGTITRTQITCKYCIKY